MLFYPTSCLLTSGARLLIKSLVRPRWCGRSSIHIRALEEASAEPTHVPELVRAPVETNQDPSSNSRLADLLAECVHNSPCPKCDPGSRPYRRQAFRCT